MDAFTFTYIPGTNPAHETGVKYTHRDEIFGLVSIYDTPSPFKPGEHMLKVNAWQVDARGRPVTITGAKVAIPEYIIPVPSDQFTTHTAMDEIQRAAQMLGEKLGVIPPLAKAPVVPQIPVVSQPSTLE